MTSTYTGSNRIEIPAKGDYVNSWATTWTNMANVFDQALDGYEAITVNTTATLTTANGTITGDQARSRVWYCTGTGGTLNVPAGEWVRLIYNGCSSNLVIDPAGAGTTCTVLQGQTAWVYCDGTNVSLAGFLKNQAPVLLSTTNITATGSINITLPSGYKRFRTVVSGMKQSSGGAVNVAVGADESGTGFSSNVSLTSGSSYNGYHDLWFSSDTATSQHVLTNSTIAAATTNYVFARTFNNMSFVLASSTFGATGTIKLYGIL